MPGQEQKKKAFLARISRFKKRIHIIGLRNDPSHEVYGKVRKFQLHCLSAFYSTRMESVIRTYLFDKKMKEAKDAIKEFNNLSAIAYHGYFESRLNNLAFNHKSGAIGIFQFKNAGLGSSNQDFMDGKKMSKFSIDLVGKPVKLDDGWDGTDTFLQLARMLCGWKKVMSNDIPESIEQAYSNFYWSPMAGGWIDEQSAEQVSRDNPSEFYLDSSTNHWVLPGMLGGRIRRRKWAT